jgi:hypothetical protein
VEFGPPPAPPTLSEQEISVIVGRQEIIVDWLKAIKEEALSRAEAGKTIPGWKVVAKRAYRNWISPALNNELMPLLAARIPNHQFKNEDFLDVARKSVSDVEKILKKVPGFDKIRDEFYRLISKSSSGNTLALAADPRNPAAIRPSAMDDFKP